MSKSRKATIDENFIKLITEAIQDDDSPIKLLDNLTKNDWKTHGLEIINSVFKSCNKTVFDDILSTNKLPINTYFRAIDNFSSNSDFIKYCVKKLYDKYENMNIFDTNLNLNKDDINVIKRLKMPLTLDNVVSLLEYTDISPSTEKLLVYKLKFCEQFTNEKIELSESLCNAINKLPYKNVLFNILLLPIVNYHEYDGLNKMVEYKIFFDNDNTNFEHIKEFINVYFSVYNKQFNENIIETIFTIIDDKSLFDFLMCMRDCKYTSSLNFVGKIVKMVDTKYYNTILYNQNLEYLHSAIINMCIDNNFELIRDYMLNIENVKKIHWFGINNNLVNNLINKIINKIVVNYDLDINTITCIYINNYSPSRRYDMIAFDQIILNLCRHPAAKTSRCAQVIDILYKLRYLTTQNSVNDYSNDYRIISRYSDSIFLDNHETSSDIVEFSDSSMVYETEKIRSTKDEYINSMINNNNYTMFEQLYKIPVHRVIFREICDSGNLELYNNLIKDYQMQNSYIYEDILINMKNSINDKNIDLLIHILKHPLTFQYLDDNLLLIYGDIFKTSLKIRNYELTFCLLEKYSEYIEFDYSDIKDDILNIVCAFSKYGSISIIADKISPYEDNILDIVKLLIEYNLNDVISLIVDKMSPYEEDYSELKNKFLELNNESINSCLNELDNNKFEKLKNILEFKDKGKRTISIKYSTIKDLKVNSTCDLSECIVCLDNYCDDSCISVQKCGHYLHDNCYRTWVKFNDKDTCPLCFS